MPWCARAAGRGASATARHRLERHQALEVPSHHRPLGDAIALWWFWYRLHEHFPVGRPGFYGWLPSRPAIHSDCSPESCRPYVELHIRPISGQPHHQSSEDTAELDLSAPYPLTHTTCFKVCRISVRSRWLAITSSMSARRQSGDLCLKAKAEGCGSHLLHASVAR